MTTPDDKRAVLDVLASVGGTVSIPEIRYQLARPKWGARSFEPGILGCLLIGLEDDGLVVEHGNGWALARKAAA